MENEKKSRSTSDVLYEVGCDIEDLKESEELREHHNQGAVQILKEFEAEYSRIMNSKKRIMEKHSAIREVMNNLIARCHQNILLSRIKKEAYEKSVDVVKKKYEDS